MDYFTERDIKLKTRLNRALLEMPPFCHIYFFGKEQTMAMRTLENHGHVIRQFFKFLATMECFDKKATDFSLVDLGNVNLYHLEKYQEYLAQKNNGNSAGQQFYTLTTFFKYFYKLGEINSNPVDRIDIPPRAEKPIIRLTQDEVQIVLQAVDNGFRIKNGKRRLGRLHLLRDKTILFLFLSTGIRVSELVGLDYGDIDLTNACFCVRRKGGNRELVYMTEELIEQLKTYFQGFPKNSPQEPMFKSIYGVRAGTKSIQEMVKHYCKVAGIEKKITPHKLRSTFGTTMYEKTRDIYMVASLLGHRDVKTTTKHYTTVEVDLKRQALQGYSLLKP